MPYFEFSRHTPSTRMVQRHRWNCSAAAGNTAQHTAARTVHARHAGQRAAPTSAMMAHTRMVGCFSASREDSNADLRERQQQVTGFCPGCEGERRIRLHASACPLPAGAEDRGLCRGAAAAGRRNRPLRPTVVISRYLTGTTQSSQTHRPWGRRPPPPQCYPPACRAGRGQTAPDVDKRPLGRNDHEHLQQQRAKHEQHP